MLTNASILESFGLLIKQPNGKYGLGENAKKRTIFLYRDALTICLHSLLNDNIVRQMTQLGNEEYVRILLDAQEQVFVKSVIFINKYISLALYIHSFIDCSCKHSRCQMELRG